MTSRTELPPLIIALTPEAHHFAKEFAEAQSIPQKRKQVYLNTLAVYAVHSYLEWMEFETDLSAGDSWNPYLCGLLDAADLVLPGIGRLECCPVLPGENAVKLPIEVAEDLIGYVAVQFEDRLDQVQLLGFAFVPAVDTAQIPEQIRIASLQPLDVLIDRLDELEVSEGNKALVNLTQWFQNVFEAGWQTIESYLNNQEENLAWRFANTPRSRSTNADNPIASVRAVKEIQLAEHTFALVVNPELENNKIKYIILRLYPTGNQPYINHNLQLIVLDEDGKTFLENKARSNDNWIQSEFRGSFGEHFSIKIVLGEVSFTEYFVI